MMKRKIAFFGLLTIFCFVLFAGCAAASEQGKNEETERKQESALQSETKRSICGTVYSMLTGNVVEGCRVTVGKDDNAVAYTNSDGKYWLDFELTEQDKFVVCFEAEGYVFYYDAVGAGAFKNDYSVEINACLERATIFYGTVKDGNGNPLSGVKIRIQPSIPDYSTAETNTIAAEIVSDENGAFRVGELQYIYFCEGYTVIFSKDGYASVTVPCSVGLGERIIELQPVLYSV